MWCLAEWFVTEECLECMDWHILLRHLNTIFNRADPTMAFQKLYACSINKNPCCSSSAQQGGSNMISGTVFFLVCFLVPEEWFKNRGGYHSHPIGSYPLFLRQ